MAENPNCTVYIGNLDERVSDRVLYDILIQAGRIMDLYIPRDKETNRPKGYAFAEYETEEIADYAVRLFSGLVTLYNRTLKFAISGQDKPSPNLAAPVMPFSNSSLKHSPHMQPNQLDVPQQSMRSSTSCGFSTYPTTNDQGNQGRGLYIFTKKMMSYMFTKKNLLLHAHSLITRSRNLYHNPI
ncbi:hypothetical protein Ancab_038936 [Ancistrocladus abbreviatus]